VRIHQLHKHTPQEFKQEHGETEQRVQELKELKHMPNEKGYRPERFEHEGSEAHKHRELTYKLRDNTEAHYTIYEPYGFNYDDKWMSPTMFEGVHGFTPTMDDPIVYHSPHTPLLPPSYPPRTRCPCLNQ
jgi:hypothetical protein